VGSPVTTSRQSWRFKRIATISSLSASFIPLRDTADSETLAPARRDGGWLHTL
jgi:hypothetical protein